MTDKCLVTDDFILNDYISKVKSFRFQLSVVGSQVGNMFHNC